MLSPSRTATAAATTALSAAPRLTMPPATSPLSPRAKSGAAMASAMALHFFGYEFARGSNVALFTSATLGFGPSSGSYYPLAMTFVSPASVALLLLYGRILDARGPRRALRDTTLLCISTLAASGAALSVMQRNEVWAGAKLLSWTASQLVVWISFVFQSSYGHLLYAQQWSFLGSILSPAEAGKYYGWIAGMSSVSSMIAGASVSKMVTRIGLPGLLGLTASALTCTLLLADWAYSLSEKHGFDPSMELQRNARRKQSKQQSKEGDAPKSSSDDTSNSQQSRENSLLQQIREGMTLFRRVPTLGALFLEALTFQSLATVLNTSFIAQLKRAFPVDADRAAFAGRFYACANGLATLFQFLILPALTRRAEPRVMWRFLPVLPLLCGVAQTLPTSLFPDGISALSSPKSALYLVAVSFLTAKTMDYSLRNVLAEMAYLPLSFEARFKGKEIIAVFANRFGKSGTALMLSALHFSGGGGGAGLPGLTLLVTLGWLTSTLGLSNLIPGKEEAERLVEERNRDGSGDGDMEKTQKKTQ